MATATQAGQIAHLVCTVDHEPTSAQREVTRSAFHRFFANRWLWAAIGLSALLQVAVVQLPVLNTAFTTTPLSLSQWLVCIAVASTVLWVSEIRKFILRRRTSRP